MAGLLWNVTFPNRDPSQSLVASATTASLVGALGIVREQFPSETPEKTWTCEAGHVEVSFDEFHRLADIPGAVGPFVASAPGGLATITSYPAGN